MLSIMTGEHPLCRASRAVVCVHVRSVGVVNNDRGAPLCRASRAVVYVCMLGVLVLSIMTGEHPSVGPHGLWCMCAC